MDGRLTEGDVLRIRGCEGEWVVTDAQQREIVDFDNLSSRSRRTFRFLYLEQLAPDGSYKYGADVMTFAQAGFGAADEFWDVLETDDWEFVRRMRKHWVPDEYYEELRGA